MSFDDIPLTDYEAEVFAECGSWKHFDDLEDSLNLNELIELFNKTIERQSRMIKTVAAAFGAEMSDDGPSTPAQEYDRVVYDQYDSLPLGIGYETIE